MGRGKTGGAGENRGHGLSPTVEGTRGQIHGSFSSSSLSLFPTCPAFLLLGNSSPTLSWAWKAQEPLQAGELSLTESLGTVPRVRQGLQGLSRAWVAPSGPRVENPGQPRDVPTASFCPVRLLRVP